MFEKYIETMKENTINEAVIAKDKVFLYSKYYASIALDQIKLYFELGHKNEPNICRISLIKLGSRKELEIINVPKSIILFVNDTLRYKNPERSLKELVSNRYKTNNTDEGTSWILYAKYSIRDTCYMICFYDLNTLSRRPNAELYEELILAEIMYKNDLVINVTSLFKMYEGPSFDFNYCITDVTVLDILLTPEHFHNMGSLDINEILGVKLEYNSGIEKTLGFDDFMKDNLVLAENAIKL